MPDTNERFTAWLSVAERNAIRNAAREFGTSQNYVVRLAIRKAFGMPVPGTPPSRTAERAEQGERV